MKIMRKPLCVLLAIILVLAVLPLSAQAKTAKPPKTAITSYSSTVSSIKLNWKKVKAKGYVLYAYNAKTKKYSKVAATSKTTYTVNKLKAGTTYSYAVKSYKTVKSKKVYSAYSAVYKASTLPAKPGGLKVTSVTDTKANLTFKAVTGATVYKVQYSADAFKTSKSVTVKSNKASITGLAPSTKYQFRVCAVRTVGKKNLQSAVSAAVAATTDNQTAFDLNKTHQTVTGFGASGAWWAQQVGGWENAEDFIKLLYSKDEGIGLNIYRYNLGAGTENDEHIKRGARAETFLADVNYIAKNANDEWTDFELSYDWNRDKNAQNILKIANQYADDLRVVLFANSPPALITENGHGYCSYHRDGYWDDAGFHKVDSYHSNLSEKKYQVYAKYLTDCADHFVDAGYHVVDVSPMNEPQYAWSCDINGNMSQEGCYYSPSELKQLASRLVPFGAGKSYKFSIFESCGVSGDLWNPDYMWQDCFIAYFAPMLTNNTIRRYYDSVSVHSYWNNKQDKAKFKAYLDEKAPGMKVACTEYCQMTNDENTGVHDFQHTLSGFDFNGMGMEHGVQLARTIFEDLTVLDATEWNWWTGVSGGYYPDGLVYYDSGVVGDAAWDSSAKTPYTSKRLWCLGNFSKFIQSGAVRVDCINQNENLLSCAFRNPDGSVVIIYVNKTNSSYQTRIAAGSYNKAEVYTTSACCDLERTLSSDSAKNQLYEVPAQSVVSVILTK